MHLIDVLGYFWNLQLAQMTTKYRNRVHFNKVESIQALQSRSFDENLVQLKLWAEPVALAFSYLELGQSQSWAITNGLACPSLNGLGLAWLMALSQARHITIDN